MLARPQETGIKLRWLISQLETCAAKDKTLLLDTCHVSAEESVDKQLSTAEQVASLKPTVKRPVSTSLTLIASCEKGQSGQGLENNTRGLFGSALANAFRGAADTNNDNRVDGNELFSYLSAELAKGDQCRCAKRETPFRFLPDATPDRVTLAAREAVAGRQGSPPFEGE